MEKIMKTFDDLPLDLQIVVVENQLKQMDVRNYPYLKSARKEAENTLAELRFEKWEKEGLVARD